MGCTKCSGSLEINTNSTCGGGCSCQATPCGIPATPTPCATSTCVSTCPQDHTQTVIVNNFQGAVKIANAWNIPACGETSIVVINGLSAITIGSYLWHPSYGYFQVVAFNPTNYQVTLENECTSGNSPVGTQVPACSEFTITDGPAAGGGGGDNPSIYPYVAIDFTAPAVGNCIDITVTNVNGLAVGKNVQIGSGTYRLAGITSATVINICNDGAGIAPGTSVIAQNAQGNYVYPVILIDVNPCTNDTITSGALIACDGTVAAPLTGATPGMIPVLIDEETGEAEYRLLAIPTASCTTLTACLTLTTGQASYTVIVADTSAFNVGDVLQIGTRSDRFTVTNILNSTTMQGTIAPVPGSIEVIPPGTSICNIECCEQLQNEIDVINEALECMPQIVQLPVPLDSFVLTNIPGDIEAIDQSFGTIFTWTNNLGCPVNIQSYVHVATYSTNDQTGALLVTPDNPNDFAVDGTMFHEVRTRFSSEAGPYTFGRHGWVQHYGNTQYVPPYPTTGAFAESVWAQVLAAAPESVSYNEGVCINTVNVAPGATVNLEFIYQGLPGISMSYGGLAMLFLVSGYVNVHKYSVS